MTSTGLIWVPAGSTGFDTASRLSRSVLESAWVAGDRFIGKYLRYGSTDKGKFWHQDEVQNALDIGFAIVGINEISADSALAGGVKGAQHGRVARASFTDLGAPADAPIGFAVDIDAWRNNILAISDYCWAHWGATGGMLTGYGDEDIALSLLALDPQIFLPNAWAWSRSIAAIKGSWNTPSVMAARIAAAARIPGVCMVQLPSQTKYFTSIDPDLLVRPMLAWGKLPVVHPPKPVPPVVVISPPVTPAPVTPARPPATSLELSFPSVPEESPMFIAEKVDPAGNVLQRALVQFCITHKNESSYLMAGLEGDVNNMTVYDFHDLKVVQWDIATFEARAKAAYRPDLLVV